MMRTARIEQKGIGLDIDRVAAALPSNYKAYGQDGDTVWITGEDVAGWTLDGYVIPRLASGLIWAKEVL